MDSQENLYNPNVLRFSGSLFVIGLVVVLLSAILSTGGMRYGAWLMFLGVVFLIYAFTPAMGEIMSEDRSWEELSTIEQLVQATKWAFIGGIVLFGGYLLLAFLYYSLL